MKEFEVSQFEHFYLIGIDHSRASVEVRERFSLNEAKAEAIIAAYKAEGGDAMMILSTCNRTEIYAFAECPRRIIRHFCEQTGQSLAEFEQYQSIAQDRAAMQHLFRVGSGLESKILGDFEIIGQIKKSFQLAKEQGAVNAFLDRLVNAAVQCSKRVKNETELSTGAASVAFAAVMQVKEYLKNHAQPPRLLLYGMGKMGRTTCENLVNQTGLKDITLINRTEEKALRLAERFGVRHAEMSELSSHLDRADVIIIATGADQATVELSDFTESKPRLVLDLSMPRNAGSSLYAHPDFSVIDVDHLSEVAQESIERRREQIPVAEAIIDEKIEDFYQWLESRRVAPTLQAVRAKMDSWKEKELERLAKKFPQMPQEELEHFARQMLNRITGQFARQLKNAGNLNHELRTIHHIFEL